MTPTQTAARAMSRCISDLADRAAAIHGPEDYQVSHKTHEFFGRVWFVHGNGHVFLALSEDNAATLRAALEIVREVAGR